MSRMRVWWQRMRRSWHSIGAELYKTMLGLVLFTALSVFVVLGYAWTLHLEQVRRYGSEMLSAQLRAPVEQIQNVLQQAETRAEQWRGLGELNDLVQLALFSAVLLTIVLPTLVAWWSARRFAGPLTQLSLAAHRMTTGDFSARVAFNQNLERRGDETALLLRDFNSMAASLERLERERRYGVAVIAHELRTPVTVLRGRLEGVRDGVIVADPQEFEKLLGHADLLSKLIEDLQLLSLAEAGALRLEREIVVMQDLLRHLHTDYLIKARQKRIELRLDLMPEPARINGDQQRLYQVFGNLLSNALRHTPAHGVIQNRLVFGAKTVLIEIQDSGAGFTAEALSRAFDRFYSSPDRGRRRGGTGLGLAISRSLVEAHDGRIEAVNAPTGACVRVRLPRA